MPPEPLPHIRAVAPVFHGAISPDEAAALGLSPNEVIDFSVNSNPLGIHPSVAKAARDAALDRYPPDGAPDLRRAIAAMIGAKVEQIVPGSGTIDLLWMITRAFVGAGQCGIVVGPTFGEYARALATCGAAAVEVRAVEPEFEPEIDGAIDAARQHEARLVFVCVPNNPTGRSLPPNALRTLVDALPDCLVVIDEAYSAFCKRPFAAAEFLDRQNICILRSLTKDHALAGLRLGYALAPERIAAAIERVRAPWNVSNPAIAAGIAATAASDHVARARALVMAERPRLTAAIRALGYPVVESDANFLLVRVGDGAALRRRLAPTGLIVRDAASFGLPEWVRISVQRPEANDRLIEAFRRLDTIAVP